MYSLDRDTKLIAILRYIGGLMGENTFSYWPGRSRELRLTREYTYHDDKNISR